MNGARIALMVVSFILGTLVLIFAIYWAYRNRRDHPGNMPFNPPIVLNFLAGHTKKSAIGYVQRIHDGNVKGNRYLMDYVQLDIDEDMNDPRIVSRLPIERGKLEIIPRGALSGFRNIYLVMPKYPSDLHPLIAKTDFGKALITVITQRNYENSVINNLNALNNKLSHYLTNRDMDLATSDMLESLRSAIKKMAEGMHADTGIRQFPPKTGVKP